MKCPFCSFPDSKVVDSRPINDGGSIRRRRECPECMKRFTTFETLETVPMIVIKKDGSREIFDKNKILSGLFKACQKRSVNASEIADEIELELMNSLTQEITSTELGEIVMKKLREVDHVAYVRFASVYREFKDLDTFMAELRALKKSKK